MAATKNPDHKSESENAGKTPGTEPVHSGIPGEHAPAGQPLQGLHPNVPPQPGSDPHRGPNAPAVGTGALPPTGQVADTTQTNKEPNPTAPKELGVPTGVRAAAPTTFQYRVAEGKVVTTLRGPMGAFQEVGLGDFVHGQRDLDELVASGALTKKSA
jgi:hypothetical protein